MSRFSFSVAALAVLAPAVAVPVMPAAAQSQRGMAEIVVFGTDPCPRSTNSEIVVCHRVDEKYRYRLPESYRPSGTRQQMESWAKKARAIETVGRTGINSCSPVGPAGFTGCLSQVIKDARDERQEEIDNSRPR